MNKNHKPSVPTIGCFFDETFDPRDKEAISLRLWQALCFVMLEAKRMFDLDLYLNMHQVNDDFHIVINARIKGDLLEISSPLPVALIIDDNRRNHYMGYHLWPAVCDLVLKRDGKKQVYNETTILIPQDPHDTH